LIFVFAGGGENMKKLGYKILGLYLKLRYSERGATAVEYGIMIALIAAVIIGTVFTIGQRLNAAFQDVAGQLPT
jgi:pilus assembly protein Flp/PilA